jgi:branched-chain amino acid aminotransferase
MEILTEKRKELKEKPQDESKLGFGKIFTDHMFLYNYTAGKGWHDARIVPYGDFSMSPAATVLHYGQEVFDGLKAYYGSKGEVLLFRPRDNFKRINNSARRLCMPEINVEETLTALKQLLTLESDWVPKTRGTSLYIRPNFIGMDPYLGVSAAHEYLFYIILSPVGAYYACGLEPVKIYVESQYVRAVKGGLGFAKTAANYAASLLVGEEAHNKGFSQALWLDGKEGKYIEEVGSMNIFFMIDGVLMTPPLEGSILPGITRDSVIQLARDFGIPVEEEKITIDEVTNAICQNRMSEAFGTGTAAVISPVGELFYNEKNYIINGGGMGPLSKKLYDTLTGIQYGELEDQHGWMMHPSR